MGLGGSPRLEITPNPLVFTSGEIGRTQGRGLELNNVGDAPLLIGSAMFDGPAPFTVAPFDSEVTVEPSQSIAIRVDFLPSVPSEQSAAFQETLTVISNDPVEPEQDATIAFIPTSAPSHLLAVPNELHFGPHVTACFAIRQFVLLNPNNEMMTIEDIVIDGADREAFRATPTATSIAPGESIFVDVVFRSTERRNFQANIAVKARLRNDSLRAQVFVQGEGVHGAVQTDHFQQLDTPKLDVLLVVDDAPSMEQERSNILRNATVMLQQLEDIDVHLGVTTTAVGPNAPSGRLLPLASPDNVIRNGNPNAAGKLLGAINAAWSTTTAENQGLQAALLALAPTETGPLNPLFVRDDAALWVVVISDRDDRSSEPVDELVNSLLEIKGFRNTNLFALSAIAGHPEQGCNTSFGQALPATRYAAVVSRTGGLLGSICDEAWPSFRIGATIGAGSFKNRFYLTNQPIAETITIEVEGSSLPRVPPNGVVNWAYDFATNSINFSPYGSPEPGAEFIVRYAAECLE